MSSKTFFNDPTVLGFFNASKDRWQTRKKGPKTPVWTLAFASRGIEVKKCSKSGEVLNSFSILYPYAYLDDIKDILISEGFELPS